MAGTQLKHVYSNDVEDAVYSSITLSNGLSGQLSVNWSDETHRKMNTQITILGKKGKIIADATEVKLFLKEANQLLGLKKGWSIKYLTELTQNVGFYLRGEEYSAQIDHFITCITHSETINKSSFRSASYTDHLISKLITDDKS